jgi:hypothetical protein
LSFFIFISCDKDSDLRKEFSEIENSVEFKKFMTYYYELQINSSIHQAFYGYITPEELNQLKSSNFEKQQSAIEMFGFKDAKEFNEFNTNFIEAINKLNIRFPNLFSIENEENFNHIASDYINTISITHKSSTSIVNNRNDEPNNAIFRIDLPQCRFPRLFSQEGPAGFACDGWVINNCQDYFSDCVASNQLSFVRSTILSCRDSPDEFGNFPPAIWTQFSTLSQSPPSNVNGVGGYDDLYILILDTANAICKLEGFINSIANDYDRLVCTKCVDNTQENCCD